MSVWQTYPQDYRKREVETLLSAVRAGECAAVVGLSGAGKSNLLGFMANRAGGNPPLALVDCNRLAGQTLEAFFSLVCRSLGEDVLSGEAGARPALETLLDERLSAPEAQLCLLFDRFDALGEPLFPFVAGGLRALRDAHKYQLTYLTASRRPLDAHNELAELFDAHTLWLGPLSPADARWSAQRAMARAGQEWPETAIDRLVELSWGYPALLRACCQAYAAGCELETEALQRHPAVAKRVEEFWADNPAPEELRRCGIEGQPLLVGGAPLQVDAASLTAKEALLLNTLKAHPGQVCEKDDLIRAVWPEDRVFLEGIRDDSLAQLVRRLRRKIEPDPENPRHIVSVIGRGYRYLP